MEWRALSVLLGYSQYSKSEGASPALDEIFDTQKRQSILMTTRRSSSPFTLEADRKPGWACWECVSLGVKDFNKVM